MEKFWIVSYAAAWVLATAQCLTVVAFLWAVGRIYMRQAVESHALITDEGPEIHAPMPAFSVRTLDGGRVEAGDYRGSELVLLLVSPRCAPCHGLLRDVERTRRSRRGAPRFLCVIEGTPGEAEQAVREFRLKIPVAADPDGAVRASLGIDRIPYGFLIDEEGVVRMKGVVNHQGQLEGLIGRRGRHQEGLSWLTEAPARQASA